MRSNKSNLKTSPSSKGSCRLQKESLTLGWGDLLAHHDDLIFTDKYLNPLSLKLGKSATFQAWVVWRNGGARSWPFHSDANSSEI